MSDIKLFRYTSNGASELAGKSAAIERVLDTDLPESYDRTTFKQKCDNVYDLAVEYAIRGKKWAA